MKTGSTKVTGSLLARNTLLNLAGQALPLLVGLAAIPYLVRGLQKDRFGILSMAWLLFNLFTLCDLGLGRAVTKFVAECLGQGEVDQLPYLVWPAAGMQLLLGLVSALILVPLVPLATQRLLKMPVGLISEAKVSFYILAASVPVVLSSSLFQGVLEAAQRFGTINHVRIVGGSLNFALPALLLSFGFHLPGIVSVLVLVKLGTMLAYLASCLMIFPILRRRITLLSAKLGSLLIYGGWVTVSNVVGPVLMYTDRLLIPSVLSTTALAYYAAPYEIVFRFLIFPGSLTATLFPAFSTLEVSGSRERVAQLFDQSLKVTLLALGPLLLIIAAFSHQILQLWLGPDFAQRSTLALQILSLGALMNALSFIPFILLQGLGRPDLTAKFHVLELPIYVLSLWFLLQKMNIAGAAFAGAIRVAIDLLLLFGACGYLRLFPSKKPTEWGFVRSLVALAVFAGLLTVGKLMIPLLLGQIGITVGLVLLFGVAVWQYVLDDRDKRFVSSSAGNISAIFLRRTSELE